ncbi:MAG: class I SAM-dependent methyltransferase, partial [Alphaproteobacteria bacterium]
MKATKDRDWASYYRKTGERPPRATLLAALDRFDAEPASPDRRLAVDLGCGSGRDVVEMLRRGWRVLAIDAEQAAVD